MLNNFIQRDKKGSCSSGMHFMLKNKKVMSSKYGPILLLEDDADEHEFVQEAYKSLNRKNELRIFTKAEDVLDYLFTTSEQPFIIIAEVQMRTMDGTELRKKIIENEYLSRKSIPFVFFTTHKDKEDVIEAYELQVQGYFLKKYNMADLQRMLHKILDYWEECVHVNNVE
jgi:DNA-binding NarL/FixJ family response regulator